MFDIYTIRKMNASGNMTKAEVIERWGTSPGEKVKKVANNTWRHTSEHGVERIILHKTAVLTEFPGGGVILKTGGWDTRTTMDRINRFGRGFGVWSERGDWYVRVHESGKKYAFVDGMMVNVSTGAVEFPGGKFMEPLPEGSATKAIRLGNLITQAIVAWQAETDAAGGKDTDPAPCRLYSLIDKIEALGMERVAAWTLMDPFVHDSTDKEA